MNLEQTKQKVIEILCESFNITKDKMFSRSRKRECADARHFLALWIRENSRKSLTEIGTLVNKEKRDHTTIISSIKVARNLIQTSEFHKNIYTLLPNYDQTLIDEMYPKIISIKYRLK